MRWRLLLLRIGMVLLLSAGGWIGLESYREHEKNGKIQSEIDALKEEADKVRRENETLSERIAYFASPDFQEQEAKNKLGLRRQEETVIGIREDPSLAQFSSGAPDQVMSSGRETSSLPNYKKWWYRFFPKH